MMVGTSFDCVSVVRYNNKPIHDAKPGAVSKRIRALLMADLAESGTAF
jgi:branched-chain amino acid aminotransferase